MVLGWLAKLKPSSTPKMTSREAFSVARRLGFSISVQVQSFQPFLRVPRLTEAEEKKGVSPLEPVLPTCLVTGFGGPPTKDTNTQRQDRCPLTFMCCLHTGNAWITGADEGSSHWQGKPDGSTTP